MITAADFAKGNTQQSKPTQSKFISAADFAVNNPPPEPTLTQKVGGVAKQLVKGFVSPTATMVARPVQLASELLGASDESVNEFTAKHFGDWIAPTPQNAKDVYKDVGRGIQTALAAPIVSTAGGVIQAGKVVLPTVGKLIAEGAGVGLGISMEQGNKLLSKETAGNVALGAGLNVAIPLGLQTVGKFIKNTKNLTRTAEELETQANIKAFGKNERPSVPVVEGPKPKLLEAPKIQPNVIPLPSPEIAESIRKLQLNQVLLPEGIKTPLIKEAEKFASKNDYIKFKIDNQESYAKLIKGKKPSVSISGNIQPIPRKLSTIQLSKIWNQAHTFEQPIIPKIERTNISKSPKADLDAGFKPTEVQPAIPYTPPKQKELIDDVVRKMEEKKVPVSEFEHQTNLGQAEAISKMDKKEVIDIALGRKPSPNQVPREAYYTFVEDLADKAADTGDTSLVMELSKSDIPSLSGQAFQALSATNKDSFTGMIRDIRAGITNKIPYAERQVDKTFNQLKSVIDKIDVKTTKPTRQAIIDALEAIKCK